MVFTSNSFSIILRPVTGRIYLSLEDEREPFSVRLGVNQLAAEWLLLPRIETYAINQTVVIRIPAPH